MRVVIVHWNQAEACLATVARFCDREVPVSVSVIDNDSHPSELATLREGLSDLRAELFGPDADPARSIELVETGRNLGFGPGANVGLRLFLDRRDDGEWCVLAPHDVDPAPGTLQTMLEIAAHRPMAGLMCADVGDGLVPVIDPYFGGMAVEPDVPIDDADLPRWENVAYPHGTLMMLRRQCLEEIGLFDERFFSYCEEADLARRASRHGWGIGLVRGARVTNIHIGSGMAVVDYLQTRNTLLLVQEMSGWYHAFIRAWFSLVQTVRGVRRPETRPLIFDASARLAGIRDFVLRRFGPPPAQVTAPRAGAQSPSRRRSRRSAPGSTPGS